MLTVLQELRVGARLVARRPGFAVVVIATLALGIGAVTTCFAILNAVAFKPLPFTDPDRLFAVRSVGRTGDAAPLTLDTVAALRQTSGTFSGIAGYATRAATIAGTVVAQKVQAARVTGDLFSLLGVPVQRGRSLAAADSGTRVAVISDDLWTDAWGSNPDVVGATLSLDGETYVVVGVAARGFGFPQSARVWVPFERSAVPRSAEIVMRLAPGVTAAQADAALTAVAAGAGGRASAVTIPLRRMMIGAKQRDMALAVLAAAVLVLLLACANLAGLLAAHIGARKYEMALRSAIGADRLRLVRQLMIESLMLAVTGGVAGLILAQWGIDLFASTVGKPDGAEWIAFAIDGRVVSFAILASLATALLFGLGPAFAGTRVNLRGVLQADAGAATPPPGPRRSRSVLVAAQLSLSLALVTGAAVIVSSAMRFGDVDPGFDRDRILAVRVAFTGAAYARPEPRFAFIDAASRRLQGLAGVTSVAVASHLPLLDRDVPYTAFVVDGATATERSPSASVRFVDAGYLTAMRIPIREGRDFTPVEARASAARAVVINDRMARRYWPDGNPVGARLRLAGSADSEGWYTIVGVVGEVSQRQLPAAPENQVYLPLAPATEVTLMVRTASDPASTAARARELVQGVDRTLAISTTTMASAYEWYASDRRAQGLVVGTLGAIAMLLAGLGVYGIMSIMVNARNREIAIRMALGSSSGAVLRLVLARSLALTSAGIGAGLVLAIGLTAFLASIFRGVRAFDPVVLAGAVALLAGVALLSSWLPARRAMRVDPMVTLKQ
jgi:predicted permease